MPAILLGVVAILLVVLYQIIGERKLREAVAAINATIPMTDRELALRIKVNQLIAENRALENKAQELVSNYGY